jgi:hypothetical protein
VPHAETPRTPGSRSYSAPRGLSLATPGAPAALVADPRDLVARALAILAEETRAWNARRADDRSPRSQR